MADPADFFRDQLPFRCWPTIPTILRTAYAAAQELTGSNPILQVESAEDNKGRLVSWAVDFGLKRAIVNGSLPCDYRWRPFAEPTGRYLELQFSHSTASVSQVKNPNRQPRNVVFRENARLRAPSLFSEFEESEPLSGAPHFILVHGHQDLNFAHFGSPSSTSKTKWTWFAPVISWISPGRKAMLLAHDWSGYGRKRLIDCWMRPAISMRNSPPSC